MGPDAVSVAAIVASLDEGFARYATRVLSQARRRRRRWCFGRDGRGRAALALTESGAERPPPPLLLPTHFRYPSAPLPPSQPPPFHPNPQPSSSTPLKPLPPLAPTPKPRRRRAPWAARSSPPWTPPSASCWARSRAPTAARCRRRSSSTATACRRASSPRCAWRGLQGVFGGVCGGGGGREGRAKGPVASSWKRNHQPKRSGGVLEKGE